MFVYLLVLDMCELIEKSPKTRQFGIIARLREVLLGVNETAGDESSPNRSNYVLQMEWKPFYHQLSNENVYSSSIVSYHFLFSIAFSCKSRALLFMKKIHARKVLFLTRLLGLLLRSSGGVTNKTNYTKLSFFSSIFFYIFLSVLFISISVFLL